MRVLVRRWTFRVGQGHKIGSRDGIQVSYRRGCRRGNIIILASLCLILSMFVLSMAVDVGYIMKLQTDLDRSVDAAALAGAGNLINGPEEARSTAVEFLVRNPVGVQTIAAEDSMSQRIADFLTQYGEEVEIETGHWEPGVNGSMGQLQVTNERPSALRVSFNHPNHPFFFGRVFGREVFTVTAQTVASYQPRDMVLVIDLSASMNDDTEFKSFDKVGQSIVEANLQQCYEELGSPVYGNGRLGFTPVWAKQKMGGGTTVDPEITVTYKNSAVDVESTHTISRVKLRFTNGSTQTFNVNTTSLECSGTGSKSGKQIDKVWVRSGDNRQIYGWNGMTISWTSSVMRSKVLAWFGLSNTPYPYGSGSWSDYVNYCIDSNGQNANAGYRFQFGTMNLVNYWLDKKPAYSQTSDLWQVSAQPLSAVKDSVDLFIDFVQSVDTGDRLGLSIYNGENGEGVRELGLTYELETVRDRARQRQAGHYHSYTNIAGGMANARIELNDNARVGAYRMMVLMTDGVANWNVDDGSQFYDKNESRYRAIQEAHAAKGLKIKIMTISLGAGADTDLMQQIADITGGIHFNIPGGQLPAEYTDELTDAFHEIADDRPLRIVR